MATWDRWALQYDVDVLSDLSEPNGPDGTVSSGSLVRTQIPPSGAPGRVGSGGRPALGSAGADLPLHPHLSPPGLWHRQRDGGQSRSRRPRGNRLRDAVRLAAALQE